MHALRSDDARGTRRPSFILSPLLTLALSSPLLAQTAAYDKVDNVGGAFVNLATFPVRPMVFDDAENLWVVNHHDSTIERFSGTTSTPNKIYGVPWNPVAIAWWDGGDPGESESSETDDLTPELLVVCRGTWAVIGIDPSTGITTRVIQLRPGDPALPDGLDTRIGRMAEPGDILIDQAHDRAFVSCTGADSVVQIDLVANQVVRVFTEQAPAPWRLKSPLFLSFDLDGESVLCAPLHSGNNSLATKGLQEETLVRDFAGLTAPEQGLPDEDLFRIIPYQNAGSPGSVQVVMTGMGTILFAHGIHPTTFDFWQLNTEANNKDPNKQTEPAVKGQIVKNQVTIVQNTSTTWGTAPQPPIVLEPGGLSGITSSNTVGQPFALSFGPSGYAFIAGLLTDNVLVLDSSGAFGMEFDLPAGAIPRGIVHLPSNPQITFVYCWGINQVRAFTVNPTASTATAYATFQLNHDPTPADVAAGRAVFFDGRHSQEHNDSCASCHIEGGSDFLLWNLSNGPLEEKGPMFTQTLVGLRKLAPFHWRGERQLADFKPAFLGLLGAFPDNGINGPELGEEPTAADFTAFEKYVFSLNNPANPNQNRERLVDSSIHAADSYLASDPIPPAHDDFSLTGDGIQGQVEFQTPNLVNVGRHACVDCHALPTGTNNDINVEAERSAVVRRASMKPAPFHEIWRKQQSLVKVSINEGAVLTSYPASFLGSGFSHLGIARDLFRFVDLVTDSIAGTTDDQKANDLTDFLIQWDQGLAPAVHFAYMLNAGNASSATTTAELDTYLHGEQSKKNCDIAVIGSAKDSGGTLRLRRWAWSRRGSTYICEDPGFANRSLAQFKTNAANGETNVFLGVPIGMAERFAIDYDMDGVRNLDTSETAPYNPSVPGTNNGVTPGFVPSGVPTFLWKSTKVARLVFEANEPVTASISYSEPNTPAPPAVVSGLLARSHSVILPGMRPSTSSVDAANVASAYSAEAVQYTVYITLTDATLNTVTYGPYYVTTDYFIVPEEIDSGVTAPDDFEMKNMRSHVVKKLCMTQGGANCDEISSVSSKWRTQVDIDVVFKRGQWQGSTPGNYEPVPAPDRIVIGRVLIQHANGVVETASSMGLTVTPLSSTATLADAVRADPAGTGAGFGPINISGVPPPAGTYLAGEILSDSAGRTYIEFEVDPASGVGMTTGDRIVFNVEAILELVPTTAITITGTSPNVTVTYPTPLRGPWNQWSFPDTMEARSSITSVSIP